MNKIRYRINKIRNYDYKRLLKEIALYLVLIIIVIIIVLIISGNIKFYIIQSDDFLETYSWMLLTMIGYGGFFTACQFFILGLTASICCASFPPLVAKPIPKCFIAPPNPANIWPVKWVRTNI